jgi:hypothetical protein
MEFKGTKGKWSIEKNKVVVKNKLGKKLTEFTTKTPVNFIDKSEYNLLLISKAPIHLQELQELFEKLSNGTISIYNSDGGNISDAYKKHYNKLIEEATEI